MMEIKTKEEVKTTDNNLIITPEIVGLMEEFGKVTMSQCAVALSSILNRNVTMTSPIAEYIPFKDIISDLSTPKVSTVVEFKEGLRGSSLLMMNVADALIVADLMTGGTGEPINYDLTEMELSAISEAINQMTGSSVTHLAGLVNKKIDIFQPKVNVWEKESDVDYKEIGLETKVARVTFTLVVDGIINSEISQVYTKEMIEDIAKLTLKHTEEIAERSEKMSEKNTNEENSTKKSRKHKSRKVSIQQAEFDELELGKVENSIDNMDLLMDVPLDFSVVLGNSRKSIKEILSLGVGSVVELDRLTDEPLDIYVNSKLIAKGEVVVINENFGIRITSILSQKQRINKLN